MPVQFIRRLSDRLNRIVENVAVLLLGALVLVVFIGVIWRYILHAPLAFVHETSILLWVWIAFLGTAVAYHRHGHIYLEFVVDRLHGIHRKITVSFLTLASLAFFYVIVTRGVEVVKGTMAQGFQTIPVSLGWEYAALPAGIAVATVHLLRDWCEVMAGEDAVTKGADVRTGGVRE